jgi:nucleoside-diphosphate-sugar epimerase
VIDAAQQAGVRKLVYTSSSAVFGVPRANPVTEDTPPSPAEDYGRAKLAGEEICRDAAASGFDVSIVRPRTILGHGRLGILQILFDWISRGFDVPVLGRGDNLYQFVHADDLAAACIAAAARPGFAIYNVGAERFGTMRETLEALCVHAGTGSHVKSVPMGPTVMLAEAARHLGISPLWSYHSLMYGRSLYFDISKAKVELGFAPRYSNVEMICESYDWYLAHRANLAGRSAHTSPVRKGVLALVPWMLKLVPG